MRLPGVLLIVVAAMLWGSTGTAQELGAPSASPLSVGSVRLVIGALALCVIAGTTGGFRRSTAIPARPAIAMALGVALYQVSFFAAVRRAGVALGTVVAIGSGPPLTGLLVWSLTRRRPGRRWALSTVVGILGVGLISSPGSADIVGVLLALCAGAAYAAYAVAAERLIADMSARGAMALGFAGGAVLLLPLVFVTDVSWIRTTGGAAAALWLGLAATAVAYLLFGAGLRSTPVTTAATLSLAEPATAFVLGVWILGERPSSPGWAGALLVLAALAWMSRPDAAT